MSNKLSGWDDTIVALATPPGIGAIGLIRISGERSLDIINDLFSSKDIKAQPSHTLHVGFLKEKGNILDEAVVSLFKKPSSYTGEDVVEISCHGSQYVQEQIIQAIINKGARVAKPGEFTQRAFLNGKLDLTQAEAVADLIASNTEASKKAALNNIRAGFSHVLKNLREQLIQFSALIELELDFSEEDVEFVDRKKLIDLIEQISLETTKLLNSFKLGNVVKNGVSVAIIGKPNAGKSTLLNTLLNENRAIVSEIAGTTRDTIEEVLNINGILFRLIDTAGIREHSSDVIENIGVEKSRQKLNEADIVLYLFDAVNASEEEIKNIRKEFTDQAKKYILAANKSDIIKDKNFFSAEIILISAREKTGIDELKQRLFSLATNNESLSENIIVTNARHYEALQKIDASLNDIKNGLQIKISADLIALDIRQCLHYISEITGDVSNEHVLDYIFSKFCIGK